MNRRLAVGVALALVGAALLLALLASGAIRHPAAASGRTHPFEFVAIGAGLALLTVGVVATYASFLDP